MRGLFSGVILIGAGLLAGVACNNLAFSQASTGSKSVHASQVNPNLTFKAESNGNSDAKDSYLGNLSDQVSLHGKDLKALKSQIAAIQKKIDQNSRLISYLNSQLLQVQVGSKLSITEKPSLPKEPDISKDGKKPLMGASQSALYNHAIDLLNQNKYKPSIDAFNSFLQKYPKTTYVNEIYYLLGQLYLMTDNNDYAISSFKKVGADSTNRPEAVLQVGKLYLLNGDAAHAKQFLERVVKDYPKSDAAEHAKAWLKTM
jgi:tol-pal system protein YbgF